MSERMSARRFLVPEIALASGLLVLAACGGDEEVKSPEKQAQEKAEEGLYDTTDQISEAQYLPDGRRITFVPAIADYQFGLAPIAVIEYCGGPSKTDLVTLTEQDGYRGAAGGVDRSPNHPACADGTLTPADETVSGR